MSDQDKRPIQTNPMFAWQETKLGLVIIVLFNLFIAYIIGSLAISSGSLLQWAMALLFLALAIAQAVKFIKKIGGR